MNCKASKHFDNFRALSEYYKKSTWRFWYRKITSAVLTLIINEIISLYKIQRKLIIILKMKTNKNVFKVSLYTGYFSQL